MKKCYWCKKSCPDDEVGDFELDPKDESIEVGWICDECVRCFIGKCDGDCDNCDYRFAYRVRNALHEGKIKS